MNRKINKGKVPQYLRTTAPFLHDARPEVFDQDVDMIRQPSEQLSALVFT